MKLWKLVSVAIVLSASISAHAAILSYGGYTHDTTTDIVTGNNLEWLQWDVTTRESIDSITPQLDTLYGGGWSIASNEQMAHLFNAFDFGITFDSYEFTYQSVTTPYIYPDSLAETDEMFIAMFGDTSAGTGSYCFFSHCFKQAAAYFGSDLDNDGLVNDALVRDDYQYASNGDRVLGYVTLDSDFTPLSRSDAMVGIALTREISAVPIPAAIWLFGSGLIGLVGFLRRKKI